VAAVRKAEQRQSEVKLALDAVLQSSEEKPVLMLLELEPCFAPDWLHDYPWYAYHQPDGYERLVAALKQQEQAEARSQQQAKPQPLYDIPSTTPESAIPTPLLVFLGGVMLLALLVVLFWWSGGFRLILPPIEISTNPQQTALAEDEAGDEAQAEETLTPPAPTPTLPSALAEDFPVTLAEWRGELERRGTELTAEGAHYWRYIPAGEYIIGGWMLERSFMSPVKMEEAPLEMPPYWIAKYPVTVEQYASFMAANGYQTREYWSNNGWRWKERYETVLFFGEGRTEPYGWDNGLLVQNTSQPVIGVTWYEATAFANWLDAQLAEVLPEGYHVRLPTDAQWEVACAYEADGNRRTYPWGEDAPTRELADFKPQAYFDQTTWLNIVGERPAGASAAGVQDMVGSVWEMMASTFGGYPQTSNTLVTDFATEQHEVAERGGAYIFNETYVDCGERNISTPEEADHTNGFRLVLGP
jgi:formylglycine-generating enzyme required for sulfatase activity